jgi:hypothetical protein
MEINGIEDPFAWSRNIVNKLQFNNTGLYYSHHLANPQQHQKGIMYPLIKSIH